MSAPGYDELCDAVAYGLRRMTEDADFAYHMLDTEFFARLCRAHAAATAGSVDAVKADVERRARPRLGVSRCADLRDLASEVGGLDDLRALVGKSR